LTTPGIGRSGANSTPSLRTPLTKNRKLGLGTLGRDELVAAIRAHADLAPDLRSEKPRLLG
jgi:hypothetical protein